MTHASTRRYRIVVGVDLTEYSQIVIEHSLDQAARHQLPELHFLYVAERSKQSIEELNERLSYSVYPALQVFNQYGSDWRARLHVRRGKPDEQIAGLAADVMADLIVVGQFGLHRKGLATRVLSNAPCATLVVGMPHALDISQCQECATIREDSAGDRWFCNDHIVKHHHVSPMTSWTAGQGSLLT
jgi:nucleotide-binding universal stress UspA family protein